MVVEKFRTLKLEDKFVQDWTMFNETIHNGLVIV